jgi:hypothetical protein
MLRKQVKNGRKLVENLESELKEAKIELSRLKHELLSQSTIVALLSHHCLTEKKVSSSDIMQEEDTRAFY